MDLQESWVKGGILITHDIQEGKHQYEVKRIVKSKRGIGDKAFVRKGDKLLQLNGSDLHDVQPEELAQKLAEGSPMLTVHKAIKKTNPIDNSSPADDVIYPYDKKKMLLNFRMEMTREENLGRDQGGVDGVIVEETCEEENEESEQEGDFLIVTMTKTSVSVVAGRSCETMGPCGECHGVGCTFSDVVMVTESSTVTLVPRGGGSFKKVKMFDASVEHVASHMFLRSLCLEKTVYASPNPEMITIYYYKSDFKKFRGVPVVLNFTGSDCFLKCCKEEERILLKVESCEKQRLQKISKSDEGTLSFVFYMKGDRTDDRTFESALHLGWFIQIINTNLVNMTDTDTPEDDNYFRVIIQKNK